MTEEEKQALTEMNRCYQSHFKNRLNKADLFRTYLHMRPHTDHMPVLNRLRQMLEIIDGMYDKGNNGRFQCDPFDLVTTIDNAEMEVIRMLK